jgi:hypothetical protein
MTSEEPIGYLEWFTELLEDVGLHPSDHIRVLTVPGSALERHANEHAMSVDYVGVADDNVLPGRLSPPATRPFLLPLALTIATPLRPIIRRAWNLHALDFAPHHPDEHRFVALAAALSMATSDAGARLVLRLPPEWESLHTYVEQLLEQSLGKSGRGIVVFHPSSGRAVGADDVVTVTVTTTETTTDCDFALYAPELAATDHASRASALLTHIMGWQLVTAIYGYLHDLPIATEPAVEPYKAYAKALRQQYLLAPPWPLGHSAMPIMFDEKQRRTTSQLPKHVSELLVQRSDSGKLRYLDVTVNAALHADDEFAIRTACDRLAADTLGVLFKVRFAPAAYHVSEQAQMDGLPGIVSLRFVPRHVPPARYGHYDHRFLTSAAVATHQAMCEAGRDCVLIVTPGDRTDLSGFVLRLLREITGRVRTNVSVLGHEGQS